MQTLRDPGSLGSQYVEEAQTLFHSQWTSVATSFTWLWLCLFPHHSQQEMWWPPCLPFLYGASSPCPNWLQSNQELFPLFLYVCLHYLARIVSSGAEFIPALAVSCLLTGPYQQSYVLVAHYRISVLLCLLLILESGLHLLQSSGKCLHLQASVKYLLFF